MAKERQKQGGREKLPVKIPEAEKGDARDKAAKAVGVSPSGEVHMTAKHSASSLELKFKKYRWSDHIETVGTREELIESGLAAGYFFDQLGNQASRNGTTEFGDRFHIERRKNCRFKLTLKILPEADLNLPNLGKVNPYKTNISEILARISTPHR